MLTKNFSGWTSDDVKKFNDVCHLVSSARENRKDLEEKYKLLVKNNNNNNSRIYHQCHY